MVDPLQIQPIFPLSALQDRFCLINLGGEIRIVDKQQIEAVRSGARDGEVTFYKRAEGSILMQRVLETLPVSSKANVVIQQFIVNPGTHSFDAVAFSPLPTPPTTLNYWTGPTIKPVAGAWLDLNRFLLWVICDGNEKAFGYLKNYLAHMLQKPEEKPDIMIVLLGGQGTGKGTFFRLLHSIWSRTTLQVSDVDQVIGQFNAALERNYVICMDEALFSGDKKSMERLKSLITEPSCRIEQKYQPSRTIDSYHRFFAASNNGHFAQIDKDDRRFLFLRLSSDYQGNLEYFEKLHQLIENEDVVSAMVFDLLTIDLDNFKVRNRPLTAEHTMQKIQSLTGFERYWLEVLHAGSISTTMGTVIEWDEAVFISTKDLTNSYKEYDKNASRYNAIQSQQIAATLEKLCPSARSKREVIHAGSLEKTQVRGYLLPSIGVARTEFESSIGCKLQWGDNSKLVAMTPRKKKTMCEVILLSGDRDYPEYCQIDQTLPEALA